ncbi:MAG: diaminopimelate epimerase [Phycisphaerales bacterium]|nr:diaminopimelate epimerase [Phycisphaerales bacterium]
MVRFTKMHGIGNDYVYVNGFEETVDDPAALAVAIADRHRGVGGDGLILILPPEAGVEADVRMRMFNADGSESEMCGNGVRCVAKYAIDHGLSESRPIRVQTGAGVLPIDWTTDREGRVSDATVDMGTPILDLAAVPVDAQRLLRHDAHSGTIEVEGQPWTFVFVSMGNPHAVAYVDDVAAIDLARLGPLVERHGAFPRRMNVHLVEVHDSGEATMRTWERGSGITLACGTGASAVCVAGVLVGRTDRRLLAHLPGGDLVLEWREADRHVLMTGPATEVFTGTWQHGGAARCGSTGGEPLRCR